MFLGFIDIFLDLIYPKLCINCGKYGSFLCANCYKEIEICYTDTCFYCGRIAPNGKICSACKRKLKPYFDNAWWCGSFKGTLKQSIHCYKYDGIIGLSEILSYLIYKRLVKKDLIAESVVVPVPIHRTKELQRGFNQSELLARSVSKMFGINGGLALKRVKNTKTQVGLRKDQRINNIAGSIVCVDKDLINKKIVLLVDDVATTGATLNECAKALKESGAERIVAVVLARD